MKPPITFRIILVAFLCLAGVAGYGQTFTVNNSGNQVDLAPGDGSCATAGGFCTLRAAIDEANALPGFQDIEFAFGMIITIDSEFILDDMGGLLIDGDIGGDNILEVVVESGSANIDGFDISGKNYDIRGLNIVGFDGTNRSAVYIHTGNATNNKVSNCFLGTDLAGNGVAVTPNYNAIRISDNANNNTIGDPLIGYNVLSGNSFSGVRLDLSAASNTIQYSIIGLDISGTVPISNGVGVQMEFTVGNGNVIGSLNPGEGNIISANGNEGIRIQGGSNTQIISNYIGTDITGDLDRGNNGSGILLENTSGSTDIGAMGAGNVISGNTGSGIDMDDTGGNQVWGNIIGLAQNGIAALPNTIDGITVQSTSVNNTIGGDMSMGHGNVISSNGSRGVALQSDNNDVFGNIIGLTAAAGSDRGNGNAGILVTGENNEIGDDTNNKGNVISGNSFGIGVSAGTGTIIESNIIGLNGAGDSSRGNDNEGIRITTTATNVTIGNGTLAGANYISSNFQDGILIRDAGVSGINISKNFIGTEIDGVSPSGNGGNGVTIDLNSSGNQIINSTITDNTGNGIEVAGGANNNIITENSIYSNGNEGILSSQVHVIPLVIVNITPFLVIQGDSEPNATIEIFLDAADEGEHYVATVTANGAGNWTYNGLPSNFPPGLFNITATQLAGGFTSDFATPPFDLTTVFDPYIVVNTNDDGIGSLRWVIGNANVAPDINTITFNIPQGDPGYDGVDERWTIAPLTNLPDLVETVIVDATTQPQPSTSEFRIVLDGQAPLLDYGLQSGASDCEFYGFYFTGFDRNSSSGGISLSLGAAGSIIGDINKGNLFNANRNGINIILADNNIIKGNLFGTDDIGTAAVPNNTGIRFASNSSGNTVGGPLPGEENLISGNTNRGILFNAGGSNTIENNLIGTDITGLLPLGNDHGIQFGTSGGNTIRGNVISGNTGIGVQMGPSNNNFFYDNKIGVGIDGSTPVGNDIGILGIGAPSTDVDNNIIGGTGAGEPNIIAHNTNEGISIALLDMEMNSFIANQIFCNGGKGIYLGTDGNDNKTPPVISSVIEDVVTGTGVNGDEIHVYKDNSTCGPLQGQQYLGSVTVVGGVWTYNDPAVDAGDFINATATDVLGNTSEFALNFGEIDVYQGVDNSGVLLVDDQVSAVDFGSAFQAIDIDEIFAIENTTTAALNISSITISGTQFLVIGAPTVVFAGATVNFIVRLSGINSGTFTETVTIISDDEDEGSFDFPVTGTINTNPSTLVTNTDPTNIPGSLRAAVDFANTNPGPDAITFDIGIQDQTITLDAPITIIDDETTIDGDILGDCVPHISISGAGIPGGCTGNACVGLIFNGNQNTIKHLNIHSYGQVAWGQAIQLNGTDNTVIGCYIGTNLAGTDATGTQNWVGIWTEIGSTTNTIGGLLACESNVISGNDTGIVLRDADNAVLGNFIGTDPTGTTTTNLGNVNGISMGQVTVSNAIGSSDPNGRNIISGNAGSGIIMSGAGVQNNLVIGNFIGTDITGTIALPNGRGLGFYFSANNNQIGDGTAAGRNIISGNSVDGFEFQASFTTIIGNYIGTDVTGTLDLGNGQAGIRMTTGGNHTIGGVNPGEGNVISGNGLSGITLTDDNLIYGNYIGTDVTGTISIPNSDGIRIGGQRNQIGDGTMNGLNVISGNGSNGILDWGLDNDILMNYIGVQSNGTSSLGNGSSGVEINFGGQDILTSNVIAFNSTEGIQILNTTQTDDNVFSQNSIHSNLVSGITINPLSQAGVLPPLITAISSTDIDGTSDNSATVEVFADAADQGEYYIGSTVADGAGNWSLAYVPASIPAGLGIATAIQTSAGNSSEFSIAVPIVEAPAVYNATQVTTTDFVANFSVPAAIDDILIDVDNDVDFSSPLVQDMSAGLSGSATVTVSLTPGIDYYYRVRSQEGGAFSNYTNSNSFRVAPGNALNFNGDPDVVVIPESPSIDFGDVDFSVELWISTSVDFCCSTIIGKHACGSGNGWFLQMLASGQFQFYASGPVLVSNSIINDGCWHHIAATFTASSNQMSIYVDGSLDASQTGVNLVANNENVGIGAWGGPTCAVGTGGIPATFDEVRIWSSTRSLSDIQDNMYSELVGNEANLEAYYRFDEGIAESDNTSPPINILPDLTANGNDGTLTSMALNGLTSNWVNSDAQKPAILNATSVTTSGFIANWKPVPGATDIRLDLDDNPDFSSPLLNDQSLAIGGSDMVNVVLSAGTQYYYRIRADVSGNFTLFSLPSSFMVEPGNALDFDGIDDYVAIADNDNLSFGNGTNDTPFTIEAWINPADATTFPILAKGSNGNREFSFRLTGSDPDKLALTLHGPTNPDKIGVRTVSLLTADENSWIHVAATYDGSGNNSNIKLYRNGILLAVDGTHPTDNGGSYIAMSNTAFGASIGKGYIDGTTFSTGNLDEVRIWNDVRTLAEIQANMSKTLVGNESNLVSYYRFDQGIPGGDNTTPPIDLLPDRSTNNNDGTLNNFTLNGLASNWVISITQRPFILNATYVTTSGFTANWEPVVGATEIRVDIDDNFDFSSPLLSDQSVAVGGMATINIALTEGTQYYYRIRADISGNFTPHSLSSSFMVTPGNALDFDGIDDAVVIPESPEIDFQTGDSFSIEFWVNSTSTTTGNFVLGKHLSGSLNGYYFMINAGAPYCSTPGHISFYVSSIGGNDACSDSPINDGKWHQVTGTYDNSTNQAKLYVDGVLQGDIGSRDGGLNNSEDFSIGLPSSGLYHEGLLDEVRVWSDVRSLAEIQDNLFNTLSGNESSLVAYYRFDQGISGGDNTSPPIDLLPDRSTNNNDGTLNNFTLNGVTSNWVISNAQRPFILNATSVTTSGLIANWEPVAGATDIRVDVDDNSDFSSPLLSDQSVAVGGMATINVALTEGTQYYYRIRADISGNITPHSLPRSFMVTPGNALDFDGVDDYVIVPDAPSLDITGDITISAWINPAALDGAFRSIVGKFGPEPEESYYFGIQNDQLVTNLVSDGVTDDSDLSSAGVITAGIWQHVAFTLNTTSTLITYYVNGIPAGTANHTGGLSAGLADIFIGWQSNGDNSTFNGGMEELRIWSIERTQAEIQADMFKTLVGNEPGLASYYRFDQGTDGIINTGVTALPGLSVNQNDGTLTNFDLGVADVTNSNWLLSGPEIAVSEGAIPIISGIITIDFGSALVGTDITLTFDINNFGTIPLNIASINSTGDPEFSIMGIIPTIVFPGVPETFDVQLSGAGAGLFNGTITINNDDVDEGVFTFPITGDIALTPEPEISIFFDPAGSNTALTDGQVTDVDFGSEIQGTDIIRTFAIENIGSAILNISGITVTGTDFTIQPPPTTVAVGSTETFDVILNGANLGPFNDVVTIQNDDTDEAAFDFPITGIITASTPEIEIFEGPDITGTPVTSGQAAAVDFGSSQIGTDIDFIFTVQNTGAADLNITLFTNTGSEFILIDGVPAPVPPGGTESFTYRLTSSTAGTFSGTITLTNNDPDEGTFTLPIVGTITSPDINVYVGNNISGTPVSNGQTSAVDLGSIIVGNNLDQSFTIENSGNSNLTISGIASADPEFSVTATIPVTILPGNTSVFTVTLIGTSTGSFNTNIAITSDDPVDASFNFQVSGSMNPPLEPEINVYMGFDNTGIPIADEQTTIIDFGSASEGTDIDRVFAIENSGASDLNISAIIFSSTEYSLNGVLPPVITPGTTEIFTVRLSGANVGTFSSTLTITNDDSDEANFECPLAGIISAPLEPEINVYFGPNISGTLLVSGQSTEVNFGTSPNGTDLDQDFTIENAGNSDLTITTLTLGGSDFEVLTPLPSVIIAGGSTNFTVRLSGMNVGAFTDMVTIESNDLDESPFAFPVTGTILAPEIIVKEGDDSNSPVVINGQPDPVDIGETPQFRELDKIFIIQNSGDQVLMINSITTDDLKFSVIDPPTQVAPGTFEQFIVRLYSIVSGMYSANLTVDSDAGDYMFPITGEVTDIGADPPLIVYNAVSPNGDGRHDFLRIVNIEAYPNNQVIIYSKLGRKVWEMESYSNSLTERRFEGIGNKGGQDDLLNGTFYYWIDKGGGKGQESGFFLLVR